MHKPRGAELRIAHQRASSRGAVRAPVLFITGTAFSKFSPGRPRGTLAEAQVAGSGCGGSGPRSAAVGAEPTGARWPDPGVGTRRPSTEWGRRSLSRCALGSGACIAAVTGRSGSWPGSTSTVRRSAPRWSTAASSSACGLSPAAPSAVRWSSCSRSATGAPSAWSASDTACAWSPDGSCSSGSCTLAR